MEEAYTTVRCNNIVVLSNRLSRWASNRKTKEHLSMPAGPEAKESPGFLDLMVFFRSPNIFCTVVQCWQSNAKGKLPTVRSETNSKTNVNMVKEHVPVQKIVLTKSYDAKSFAAASYLDAGRRIKDSGRPVDTYIYISWQKAKSTRNCGARLRLAPIMLDPVTGPSPIAGHGPITGPKLPN